MISLLARFFMFPKPQVSPAPEPVVKKKRSVKKPALKKPTQKSRAKKKP